MSFDPSEIKAGDLLLDDNALVYFLLLKILPTQRTGFLQAMYLCVGNKGLKLLPTKGAFAHHQYTLISKCDR